MNLLAKQKWRYTNMSTKRGRENGMSWEIGIDIYTLLCIK